MLTKTDLKQIGQVVDERLEIKLEEKLEQKLKPIRNELNQIGQVIDKKLKPIKKDLRYLRKTVDLIVTNYDEADIKLHRRVKRIEHHLALP